MNCQEYKSTLISGVSNKETEQHLSVCPACLELERQVNLTMSLLDEHEEIPESLVSRVMSESAGISVPKVRKINVSTIIQVAAAIVFGVFIGHKFGKIANIPGAEAKQDPINQYVKAHHMNLDPQNFESSTLILKH